MRINHYRSCFMVLLAGIACSMSFCNQTATNDTASADSLQQYVDDRIQIYEVVELTTDLTALSDNDKEVLPLLIKAAQVMDDLFWLQAYPQRDSLLATITDEHTKAFIDINYGPWDRLNGDKPFIEGVGTKPLGAFFYPPDMTKEEFENSGLEHDMYSVIRRNPEGNLIAIPYSEAFNLQLNTAADYLRQAAEKTNNEQLRKYLVLRAAALVSDDYDLSDRAWLDMKTNGLDIIIGPIENYEDKLFNSKAAFESYVLVKDKEWSARLAKYVSMLPGLQKGLPVDPLYKKENPGTDSELNAYDVVYYAGDCNSGSKTIAVNLPNSEVIQQEKGTRRSQLKNAMRAKFDKILLPISNVLIDPEQREYINFDAFFSNVMFHEVAHGLGVKQTINGKGFVREALQEQYSWLEECKADVLGLYMVTKLLEEGELDGSIEDYYTTFMAGILRSVRFGASSAHGKANMMSFNFFQEKGAFKKNDKGYYQVDYNVFRQAMDELGEMILVAQGDGDKAKVESYQREYGIIQRDLQGDLNRLTKNNIPVDIVFEQGVEVLGL
ncbi:dipeptidyl-peptidase 3 family protein [Albibacterium indicum]|uniref:dipeptidyl-peptidase 3 family protein n=1 Tax=Albibacterium indicum TaxID=2292082 RepID=UPI001FE93CD7|nr:Zn-dependent hydrolase [Pedobacter indicus]